MMLRYSPGKSNTLSELAESVSKKVLPKPPDMLLVESGQGGVETGRTGPHSGDAGAETLRLRHHTQDRVGRAGQGASLRTSGVYIHPNRVKNEILIFR
jgi:hypothetical protein